MREAVRDRDRLVCDGGAEWNQKDRTGVDSVETARALCRQNGIEL